MSDAICTRHAETRMQQRGIRKKDIRLILAFGTQVDDETWFYAQPGCCPRDRDPQAGDPGLEPACESQGRDPRRACHHRLSLTSADQKRTLRRGRRKGLL